MSNASNTQTMKNDKTVAVTITVDYDWIHDIICNYNSAFEDILFSDSQLQSLGDNLGDILHEHICECVRDLGQDLLEDIQESLAHADDEHDELNRLE